MATVTKKGRRTETPVSNGYGLLNDALDQFKLKNLRSYEYQPGLNDFSSNESLEDAGFKEDGKVFANYTENSPFIWLEFYTYPKIAESSLSYRLINGDGFSSLYEGLLLVSYDLTNEAGGTTGSTSDGLLCQKNLSIEVLESACEKMGFSELLSHLSADSYDSTEKYDYAIGVGFKGFEFHYREGKGECVKKSEAVVVNCGINMAPNASFNDLTFNLVSDQSSIPSDPLLSSDWVSPLYRDPTAGYLLVTVSVLGKISTGMVCNEGVSEDTKTAMCLRMGFHTFVTSSNVFTNQKIFLTNVSHTNTGSWQWKWKDCPGNGALWLECGFDPTLCKSTMENGYLVFRCSHQILPNPHLYRCLNSHDVYRVRNSSSSNTCDVSFSSLCPDDPKFFQICAHKNVTVCPANDRVKPPQLTLLK
eukprot:sb/3465059/